MNIHFSIKKSIYFVLVTVLLIGVVSSTNTAFAVERYDFPNFTEEDGLSFVNECGIEIPEKLSQSEYLSTFTLELILQSYSSPDDPFCFNYPDTQAYAENIREAVKTYMNTENTVATGFFSPTLQYSTIMDENGNWVTSGGYYNTKWDNYNCYAYSINRAEQPQYYPSSPYVQYQPGDMGNQGNFKQCKTIDQLAVIVCNDLMAMGYSNISLSYLLPTVSSSQNLICVRMLQDVDYHFMRYDFDTDSWYHKPSLNAVLKYNYTPSNNYIWNNERVNRGRTYRATFQYNSDIIFITYDKNQINVNTDAATINIQAEKDVLYELNLANSGTYQIVLDSEYSVSYEIYNANFDVITSGNGLFNVFSINVNSGKYYLRMNFESYERTNYVNVSVHTHLYTYSWLSNSHHQFGCNCGLGTVVEEHYAHEYTRISSTKHNVYCECGYLIKTETHSIVEDSTRYSHCVECGAVFDKFSDITIKGFQENELTK